MNLLLFILLFPIGWLSSYHLANNGKRIYINKKIEQKQLLMFLSLSITLTLFCLAGELKETDIERTGIMISLAAGSIAGWKSKG